MVKSTTKRALVKAGRMSIESPLCPMAHRYEQLARVRAASERLDKKTIDKLYEIGREIGIGFEAYQRSLGGVK
jgi:hypothetical protein